ncbi:MAG TPA: zinc-finger domain-containing protein [Chiayiivirga sp.]|nr:zinc-finger domain-containing protein [Chiayiivirga sp.]
MTTTPTQPDTTKKRVEVTRADLRLSCPMPGTALWNMHPQVYLPVDADGEATCPYCSTVYVFKG